MSAKDQSTQVTLITGGGSGIGAATALRLLGAGHCVAITGRDEAQLSVAARDMEDRVPAGQVLAVPGDATDYGAVTAAVAATVGKFGRLDVAIANAGFSTQDTLADGDPERWREMVLTNVLGPALLVRAALPELVKTRGRVVLIGSVAGLKNSPGNMYSVTKWAVNALAENTRMMVTGQGVGVTLLAPGKVDTPFWGDAGLSGPALSAEAIAEAAFWSLAQPAGVDVNEVVLRPLGQSA